MEVDGCSDLNSGQDLTQRFIAGNGNSRAVNGSCGAWDSQSTLADTSVRCPETQDSLTGACYACREARNA